MRWQAVILAFVAVGTTLAGEERFLFSLQGEWKMQKATNGGKVSGDDERISMATFIVKNAQSSMREGDGKPFDHATIVLDASKMPVTIDLVPEDKKEGRILGIVVLGHCDQVRRLGARE